MNLLTIFKGCLKGPIYEEKYVAEQRNLNSSIWCKYIFLKLKMHLKNSANSEVQPCGSNYNI